MKNTRSLLLLSLICWSASYADTMPQRGTPASPLPAIIQSLTGRWNLEVNFEPASGLPAGTSGQGEESWHAAVDGKALISEESWKAGPVAMSLLGVLWWDGNAGRLHAMDCNNQGKGVCDPKDAVDAVIVKWNGSELTIEEPERGRDGKIVTSRITFKDFTSDTFSEIASLETRPGHYEIVTTIHAVRTHS